jgi:single-strand DNA-binding protein
MNSIILLGRATSSIELKQTPAGKMVVNFSLAVKRPFTKDVTDFHSVTAWDKQAELLSKYVNKGDQVCVRGYLTTRTYTDKQGQKRTAVEVVADEVSFVGNKESKESSPGAVNQPYIPSAYTQNTSNFEAIPNPEGLPF